MLPWWKAFSTGRTRLEELDAIRARVDGASSMSAAEVATTVRNHRVQIMNLDAPLDAPFAFGYCYGHFGQRRGAMVKYGNFYLPSDLHISGSRGVRRGAALKVGKRTTRDIERWREQWG